MDEICGGAQPYLSEGHLDAEHLRIRDKAIFQVSLTFGFDCDFFTRLVAKYYHSFIKHSD